MVCFEGEEVTTLTHGPGRSTGSEPQTADAAIRLSNLQIKYLALPRDERKEPLTGHAYDVSQEMAALEAELEVNVATLTTKLKTATEVALEREAARLRKEASQREARIVQLEQQLLASSTAGASTIEDTTEEAGDKLFSDRRLHEDNAARVFDAMLKRPEIDPDVDGVEAYKAMFCIARMAYIASLENNKSPTAP